MAVVGAGERTEGQRAMAVEAVDYRNAPSRFWRWWTAELAGLASLLSPARFGWGAYDLVVTQGADGAWIAKPASGGGGYKPLDGVIETAHVQTVKLCLPAADCFLRRVALPDVARSEIARLLALDLERATPFKISETYSGHTILSEPARPGFVNVLQVITPRDAVDAKRADLEARGLRVTAIDCSDADAALAPVNLLVADRSASAPISVWRWLLPAVVLLLGSAIAIDSGRHDAAIATLAADTNDALAVLKSRRQSSQTAEAVLAQTAAVQRLAQTRVPRTHILNELARVLPDSVWLTDLKIESDVIDISGHAKSAAELVGLFEASDLFTGAELTSAITRVEDIDRQRFSLRTRLKASAGDTATTTTPDRTAP